MQLAHALPSPPLTAISKLFFAHIFQVISSRLLRLTKESEGIMFTDNKAYVGVHTNCGLFFLPRGKKKNLNKQMTNRYHMKLKTQ